MKQLKVFEVFILLICMFLISTAGVIFIVWLAENGYKWII